MSLKSIGLVSTVFLTCLTWANEIKKPTSVIVIDNQNQDQKLKTQLDNFEQEPLANIYSSWIGMGLGYTFTRWSQIENQLQNGGLSIDVTFGHLLTDTFEASVKFHQQTSSPTSANQDNVGASHLALGARQYFSQSQFVPFVSAYLQYGVYRVWPLINESSSEVSYRKVASGSLIGFTPDLGIRIHTNPLLAFELSLSYIGYFDNPQYKLGGWNVTSTVVLLRH